MPDEQISVREFFLERLREIQKLEDERWRGHQSVHDMGQRAIDSTFQILDTRLESMNQFRAQILEERSDFVHGELYRSEYKALEKRLSELDGFRSNIDGRIWMLGAVFAVVNLLVVIILHFWK